MDYARKHHKRLGSTHPSYGVSYKYLLYDRDNIGEMYMAAKLAKEIGCKNIHFRPAGTPWDKIGTPEEIARVKGSFTGQFLAPMLKKKPGRKAA